MLEDVYLFHDPPREEFAEWMGEEVEEVVQFAQFTERVRELRERMERGEASLRRDLQQEMLFAHARVIASGRRVL